MDSWLIKLLSRENKNKNMKTKIKNKDQPINIIIKNNNQIKAMANRTPTMDHYPRNGKVGNTDP